MYLIMNDKSFIPFFDYSIWDKDIRKVLQYLNIGRN